MLLLCRLEIGDEINDLVVHSEERVVDLFGGFSEPGGDEGLIGEPLVL